MYKKVLFTILISLGCFSFNAFGQQDFTDELVVYYFHGNARCVSCRKIEQYTKEALEKFYKNEIDDKKIVFNVINTEEQGNEHFINDYQLYTKSVVLSQLKKGAELKHKNLEGVWQHIHNKENFYNYIHTQIENFLGIQQGKI